MENTGSFRAICQCVTLHVALSPSRLNEERIKSANPLTVGRRGVCYTRQESRMSLSPNPRPVGGNDESGRITCHHLEFTILCRSLLHHPNSPYSVRLFGTKSSRCPLLPLSKTRCRPSKIKTRALGSPSKRLETCETADHNPRVQNQSVCTISPLSLKKPHFCGCSPHSQEPLSLPLVLEASSSTPPITQTDSADDVNSVDFVARVSTIPLVNTALRAYEQTKASSRVVKVRFFLHLSHPPPFFSNPP